MARRPKDCRPLVNLIGIREVLSLDKRFNVGETVVIKYKAQTDVTEHSYIGLLIRYKRLHSIPLAVITRPSSDRSTICFYTIVEVTTGAHLGNDYSFDKAFNTALHYLKTKSKTKWEEAIESYRTKHGVRNDIDNLTFCK